MSSSLFEATSPYRVGLTRRALAWSLVLGACGADNKETMSAREPPPPECVEASPGELFEQRIKPLFSQDRPNSCSQCHLAGIDLEAFVRPDPCETMACLTEKGLVDLEEPENSVILSWIQRAQPESELITTEVINQEYEGFKAFIEYSALCGRFTCSAAVCKQPGQGFCDTAPEPGVYSGDADPGDCSEKTLERVFRDTVYASRGRCYPCHFSEQKNAAPTAPRWISQEGTCDQASLATMHNVIRSGYVNVDDPQKSLLLLKPLGPVNGGVDHGGGSKFLSHGDEDPGYENFLYWLTRYAACQKP